MDGVIQPDVQELPGTTDTPVFAITRSWKNHRRWESVPVDRTTGRFQLTQVEEASIFGYCIQLTFNDSPMQRIRGFSFALKLAQVQQLPLPAPIFDTLTAAFDSWVMFDAESLDEAFKLQKRTSKETGILRRRRILEEKIWHAVMLEYGHRARDKSLFSDIGKVVGLCANTTEQYFRRSRQRVLQNHLSGGVKVGRPRKK